MFAGKITIRDLSVLYCGSETPHNRLNEATHSAIDFQAKFK